MLSEDLKLRFTGFEPTHDVRSAVHVLLNDIFLKSPSRSFLSATFTLTNGIFEGVIKISSSAGSFVAKSTDAHMPNLGHKLRDTLASQLEKWKTLRFE